MGDLAKQEFEPIVNIDSLTPEEKAQAENIASQIDVDDSQAVIQYGVGAQQKISGFADTILGEIRAKDSGEVGEILTDLTLKIKDVGVGNLSADGGFLQNIPLLGGLFNKVKKFIARYDKLSVQIEKITADLDQSRMTLIKDITMLDTLYEKNSDYLKELDVFIAAGQIKLKELYEVQLPALKQKALDSNDPLDAQKLQDFNQFVNRFEKKLHDLKLTRMISIQTGPQVRLVQSGNQTLVEKIQSSILNTIPLWKNQIIIAISLFRQKKALKVQKEVTDATNDLLAKNAAMLKDSSIEVAKESERGIVDIETLKQVNNDLISTIEETLKIQQEGRQKRQLAEQEIAKMEQDLKAKLVQVQGP